jgi:hypothetical protein
MHARTTYVGRAREHYVCVALLQGGGDIKKEANDSKTCPLCVCIRAFRCGGCACGERGFLSCLSGGAVRLTPGEASKEGFSVAAAGMTKSGITKNGEGRQ